MDIHIEFHGFRELEDELHKKELEVATTVIKEMDNYLALAERGARALAPRFDGDLEQSIVAAKALLRRGVVVGTVGTNLAYAWRRHEEPYRKGSHNLYHRGLILDNYYLDGRGERTRKKRKWRGLMPGRKYMERMAYATEDDFDKYMEAALKKIMGE